MRVRFLIAYLCVSFIVPPQAWSQIVENLQQQQAQNQAQAPAPVAAPADAQVPADALNPAVPAPVAAAPAVDQTAVTKPKASGPSDRRKLRDAFQKGSWQVGAAAQARIPGLLQFRPSEFYALFRPYKDCRNPFEIDLKSVSPKLLVAELAKAQDAWVEFLKGREAEIGQLHVDRASGLGEDPFPKAIETVELAGKKCQPAFFSGKGVLMVEPSEGESLGKILKMVNDEGKSISRPPLVYLMAVEDERPLTTIEIREQMLVIQGLRLWAKLYSEHFQIHGGGTPAALPDLVIPESIALKLKTVVGKNLVEAIAAKISMNQQFEAGRLEELTPRFVRCGSMPDLCGTPMQTRAFGANDYCFCDAKEERLRKMDLQVMQELVPSDPSDESRPHSAYLSALKKLGIKGLLYELATVNSMLPAGMKVALPNACHGKPELAYYLDLFNDLNALPERINWVSGFNQAVDSLVEKYQEGLEVFPLPERGTEFYTRSMELAVGAVTGGAPGAHETAEAVKLAADFSSQQSTASGMLAYMSFEDRISEGDRVLGQDYANHFGKKLRILSYLYQESMERLENLDVWKKLSKDEKEKYRFEILKGIAREALVTSYQDALAYYVLSLFEGETKAHMADVWESTYAAKWEDYLGSKKFASTLDKLSENVAKAIVSHPAYNPTYDADAAAEESARRHVRQWAPMALEAARVGQARRVLLQNQEGLSLSSAALPGVSGLGWINPWNGLNYKFKEGQVTDVSQVPACYQTSGDPTVAARYPFFSLDPVSASNPVTDLIDLTKGQDYEHVRRGLVKMLDDKGNFDKFVEYLKSRGYTDEWVRNAFVQEVGNEGKVGETVRVERVADVRTLAKLILDRFKQTLQAEASKDPGASAKKRREAFQPLQRWLLKGDLSKKSYEAASKQHAEILFDRYLAPALQTVDGATTADGRAFVAEVLSGVHAREIMIGQTNLDRLLVGYAGYRAEQDKIDGVFEALNEPISAKGEIRNLKGLEGAEGWANFCKTYSGKHQNCAGYVNYVTGPMNTETFRRLYQKRMKIAAVDLIQKSGFLLHFHPGARQYRGEETLAALELESKEPPKEEKSTKPEEKKAENAENQPAVEADDKKGPAAVVLKQGAASPQIKQKSKAELATEALKAAKTVRVRLMRQLFYGFDAAEFPFQAESLPASEEAKQLLAQIDALLGTLSQERPKTDQEKEEEKEKPSRLAQFLDGLEDTLSDPESYLTAVRFYLQPQKAIEAASEFMGARRARRSGYGFDPKWAQKTVGTFLADHKVFESWLARRNQDVAQLQQAVTGDEAAVKASFPLAMILIQQTPELILGSQGLTAADWAREEYFKRLPSDLLPSFETFREEVLGLMVQLEAAGDMAPNAEVNKLEKDLAEANFALWQFEHRQTGAWEWLARLPENVGRLYGSATGYNPEGKAGESFAIKDQKQAIQKLEDKLKVAVERRDQWQRLQRLLAIYLPNDVMAAPAKKVLEGSENLDAWNGFFAKQFLQSPVDASGQPLLVKSRGGVETPITLGRVLDDLNEIAEVSKSLIPVSPKVADQFLSDTIAYCGARSEAGLKAALEAAYGQTLRAEVWFLVQNYQSTVRLIVNPDLELDYSVEKDQNAAEVRAAFSRLKRIWNQGEQPTDLKKANFPQIIKELLTDGAALSEKLHSEKTNGGVQPATAAQQEAFARRISALGFPSFNHLCEKIEVPAKEISTLISPLRDSQKEHQDAIATGTRNDIEIPRPLLARYWEEVALPATDLFHGPRSEFGPLVSSTTTDGKETIGNVVWFQHAPTGDIADPVPSEGKITDAFVSKALGDMVLTFTSERLASIFARNKALAAEKSADRINALNKLGATQRRDLYLATQKYFDNLLMHPETRPSEISTLIGPLANFDPRLTPSYPGILGDTGEAPGASEPVDPKAQPNPKTENGAPGFIPELPGEEVPGDKKAAAPAMPAPAFIPELDADPVPTQPAGEKTEKVEETSQVPNADAGQPPAVIGKTQNAPSIQQQDRTPTPAGSAEQVPAPRVVTVNGAQSSPVDQNAQPLPPSLDDEPIMPEFAEEPGAPVVPKAPLIPPAPVTTWLQPVKESPLTRERWTERMQAYLRLWEGYKNSLEFVGTATNTEGTVGYKKLTLMILETFLAHTPYRLARHHLYVESGIRPSNVFLQAETAEIDPTTGREIYGPREIVLDSLQASLVEYSRYSMGERHYIVEDIRSIFAAEYLTRQAALLSDLTEDNALRSSLHLKPIKLTEEQQKKLKPQPFETGRLAFRPFERSRELGSEAQVLELYAKYFRPSSEELGDSVRVSSLEAWSQFCDDRLAVDRPCHTLDKESRTFRFGWEPAGKPLHQAEQFHTWLADLASDPVAAKAFERRANVKASQAGVRLWAAYPSLAEFQASSLYTQLKGLIALSDQNARAPRAAGTYGYFLALLNWNTLTHGDKPVVGPALANQTGTVLWDDQKAGLMDELVSFYKWNPRDFNGWKDVLHRWGSNDAFLEIATAKRHFLIAVGDRRFGATHVDATVLPNGKAYLPTPVHPSEQAGFGETDEQKYQAWIGDPKSYRDAQLEPSRTSVHNVAEQMAMAQGEVASLWNVRESNPLVRDRQLLAEKKSEAFRYGEGFTTLSADEMSAILRRARALQVETNSNEVAALHQVREAWADFRRIVDSYRTSYDPTAAGTKEQPNSVLTTVPVSKIQAHLNRFATQMQWPGPTPQITAGPTGDAVANAIYWSGRMASAKVGLKEGEAESKPQRDILAVLSGHFTEGALTQEFYRGVKQVSVNINDKLTKLCNLDTQTIRSDDEFKKTAEVIRESEIALHDGISELVNEYLPEGNRNKTYRMLQQMQRQKVGWELWRDRLSVASQVGMLASLALTAIPQTRGAGTVGLWFTGIMFGVEGASEVADLYWLTPERLQTLASIRDTRFQGYMSLMKDDSALLLDGAYETLTQDRSSTLAWTLRVWMMAQAWTMAGTATWKAMRGGANAMAKLWWGPEKYLQRSATSGLLASNASRAGMSAADMKSAEALSLLSKRTEERLVSLLEAEQSVLGEMRLSERVAKRYRNLVEARLKMIEGAEGAAVAEYRGQLMDIQAKLAPKNPPVSFRDLQTLHIGSGAMEEAKLLQPMWQRFLGVPEEVFFIFSVDARSLAQIRNVVIAEARVRRFLSFDRLRLYLNDNEVFLDRLFRRLSKGAPARSGEPWQKEDFLAALFDSEHELYKPVNKLLSEGMPSELVETGTVMAREGNFAAELSLEESRRRLVEFAETWVGAGLPIDPKDPMFRPLLKAFVQRDMKTIARAMVKSKSTLIGVGVASAGSTEDDLRARHERAELGEERAPGDNGGEYNPATGEIEGGTLPDEFYRQIALDASGPVEEAVEHSILHDFVSKPAVGKMSDATAAVIVSKAPESLKVYVRDLLVARSGSSDYRRALRNLSFVKGYAFEQLGCDSVEAGMSLQHITAYAKAAEMGLPIADLEASALTKLMNLAPREGGAAVMLDDMAFQIGLENSTSFGRGALRDSEFASVLGFRAEKEVGALAVEGRSQALLAALSKIAVEDAPNVGKLVERWSTRIKTARNAYFSKVGPPPSKSTPFYVEGSDLFLGAPPVHGSARPGFYSDDFSRQVLAQTPASEQRLTRRLLAERLDSRELEQARDFWLAKLEGLGREVDVYAPELFLAETDAASIRNSYERMVRLAKQAEEQVQQGLTVRLLQTGEANPLAISELGAQPSRFYGSGDKLELVADFDDAARMIGVKPGATSVEVSAQLSRLEAAITALSESPWKTRALNRLARVKSALSWNPAQSESFQQGLEALRQGLAADGQGYLDHLLAQIAKAGHPGQMIESLKEIRRAIVVLQAKNTATPLENVLNRLSRLLRGEVRLHLAEVNGVQDLATVRTNWRRIAASGNIRYQFDLSEAELFASEFAKSLQAEVANRSGQSVADEIGAVLKGNPFASTDSILKSHEAIMDFLGELPEDFVNGTTRMRYQNAMDILMLQRAEPGLELAAMQLGDGLPFEMMIDPSVLANPQMRFLVWGNNKHAADLAAALFVDDATFTATGFKSSVDFGKLRKLLQDQAQDALRTMEHQNAVRAAQQLPPVQVQSYEQRVIQDITRRHEWCIEQHTLNADARRMKRALDRLEVPQEQRRLSSPQPRMAERAAEEATDGAQVAATEALRPPQDPRMSPGGIIIAGPGDVPPPPAAAQRRPK